MASLLPVPSGDVLPGSRHFGSRFSPVRRYGHLLLLPALRSLPAPAPHRGFPPSQASSPSCVWGCFHGKGRPKVY
ncbi:hypothetical protein FKM82_026291 [Ascaphus truei]